MRFGTFDEFDKWVRTHIEFVDEQDYECCEITEDDEEEANAFFEIFGKICYNYGRLEGLAQWLQENENCMIAPLWAAYRRKAIVKEIDAGVEVLDRYFKRVDVN